MRYFRIGGQSCESGREGARVGAVDGQEDERTSCGCWTAAEGGRRRRCGSAVADATYDDCIGAEEVGGRQCEPDACVCFVRFVYADT